MRTRVEIKTEVPDTSSTLVYACALHRTNALVNHFCHDRKYGLLEVDSVVCGGAFVVFIPKVCANFMHPFNISRFYEPAVDPIMDQ